MDVKDNFSCKKGVKVVACYLGDRRNRPRKSKETFFMLKYLWEKEMEIDNGFPMDTLFIYNKIPDDQISNKYYYKKCEEFLYGFHGKKTKNGDCSVFSRENIGLSYGAFDWAFFNFKDKYDYWMFIEDDCIVVKNGVMKQCVYQLEQDPANAFIAIIGVNRKGKYPIHAHASCGVVHKDILNKVVSDPSNFSKDLGRGFLPYLYNSDPKINWYEFENVYKRIRVANETILTNFIHNLGYNLCDIEMDNVVTRWRIDHKYRWRPYIDNTKVIPFDKSIYNNIFVDCTIQECFDFKCCQDVSELTKFASFCKSKKIKNVLEIGTEYGGTLYVWCSLSEPNGIQISVDLQRESLNHTNYIEKRNNAFRKIFDNVHFINEDSHKLSTYLKVLKILKGEKVDLLFIDGDHSENGVKTDYCMYKGLVKKGGIIAFHDIKDTPFHRKHGCFVCNFWNTFKCDKKEIINKYNKKFGGIGYFIV